MKKNFKKLVLNKSTLSNLENNQIVGGDVISAPTNCLYCQTYIENKTCNPKTCIIGPTTGTVITHH